jgi:hypothetical protein
MKTKNLDFSKAKNWKNNLICEKWTNKTNVRGFDQKILEFLPISIRKRSVALHQCRNGDTG